MNGFQLVRPVLRSITTHIYDLSVVSLKQTLMRHKGRRRQVTDGACGVCVTSVTVGLLNWSKEHAW